MTSLLFAIAYWLVIFWAACGAVVLLTFIWFCIEEWWRGPANAHRPIWADDPHVVARPLEHGRWCRNCRIERERFRPVPPYDQDDPLERLFSLPSEPRP